MNDKKLKELFFNRDEEALRQTDILYGSYCRYIAMNILKNEQDCEEAVNDAYIRLWDTVPPNEPQSIKAYLARVVKNTALDMARKRHADKRGGGEYALALEELTECTSGSGSPEDDIEGTILKESIERFLKKQKADARIIFIKRYWYFCSISEIANELGKTGSSVKVTLMRLRQALKKQLEQEGFDI